MLVFEVHFIEYWTLLGEQGLKVMCSKSEPMKVMISGAPASGKGTQCEMIVKKVSLFFFPFDIP